MEESFSTRLKKMMLMKGRKGKDLAHEINVAPATITTYLNGRSEPPFDKLLAICEVFKCTPNDLMLGEENGNLVAEERAVYNKQEVEGLKTEAIELKEENRALSNRLMQAQEKIIDLMGDK